MNVALVTGAARGIGAATVHALASRNYRVLALDACAGTTHPYPLPTPADLEAVAAPFGDRVRTAQADVRDRPTLEREVADVLNRWGRLDVVVAAAAVIRGGKPLWDTPEQDLVDLLDIDLRGVWNTAAACVPAILNGPEPSRGRFVAVASAAGTHGMFNLTAYNVAKHGVVGLVRGLAADLVGTGATACAISPGSTETAMLHATADLYDATIDDLVARQYLRRPLQPNEIAETIAFACSPAGAVLNGSVVAADGGFV